MRQRPSSSATRRIAASDQARRTVRHLRAAIAAATQLTYLGAEQPQCLPLQPADTGRAGRVAWLIPHRPDAVRPARDAATALVATRCDWAPVDDVREVLSEVVTNAIRHGAPPCVLYLEHAPDRLLAAVYDGGPGFLALHRLAPRTRAGRLYTTGRTGGRGLGLINDLTHGWSTSPMSGGTIVIARWRAKETGAPPCPG